MPDGTIDLPAASPEPLHIDDAAALTATYRRYAEPLVRYAGRFTGDVAAAHDVVQDVFVTLWERRTTLTIERSLQALLYTMTRNRALNYRRRMTRSSSEALDEEDGASVATAEPAPDARMAADDLAHHLRRFIAMLPPRRAEAFSLSRFDGLSHADIAEVMGLSVRTVDTHVVHALRALRRRLDALLADASSQPDSGS